MTCFATIQAENGMREALEWYNRLFYFIYFDGLTRCMMLCMLVGELFFRAIFNFVKIILLLYFKVVSHDLS